MPAPSDKEAHKIAESLGSVTVMYQRAVDGDSQATRELWEVYSRRLFGLARAVLRHRGVTPAEASEDSVVNSAFAKFFDALARGKYRKVADRHELWCLLAVITRNSALDRVKRAQTQVTQSVDTELSVNQYADAAPTPGEIAALSESIATLEQQIRDRSTSDEQADRIICVLTMTLSGHTRREIAAAIGQSEVTVRRNLHMIRDLLSRQ